MDINISVTVVITMITEDGISNEKEQGSYLFY